MRGWHGLMEMDDIDLQELTEYFNEILSVGVFEYEINTSKGIVDILCEIEIINNGEILHIKDMAIYPRGRDEITGFTRELLEFKTKLIDYAHKLGFKGLKITAKRVKGSTSANPGHHVNILIDIETRFK
jgi:endo-1,4-beta-mannosidase